MQSPGGRWQGRDAGASGRWRPRASERQPPPPYGPRQPRPSARTGRPRKASAVIHSGRPRPLPRAGPRPPPLSAHTAPQPRRSFAPGGLPCGATVPVRLRCGMAPVTSCFPQFRRPDHQTGGERATSTANSGSERWSRPGPQGKGPTWVDDRRGRTAAGGGEEHWPDFFSFFFN
uniref:Uncharacterized protein n=1 Tax=Setaria viridis TaxID=4556 RepID=A0A4U6W0J0_SETVI|nr:hypothetical protein SEVIR_2G327401v2 [Setaria viridis]